MKTLLTSAQMIEHETCSDKASSRVFRRPILRLSVTLTHLSQLLFKGSIRHIYVQEKGSVVKGISADE